MTASETSFTTLSGVPVRYDRLPPDSAYGSNGASRTFACRHKLKDTLETCMAELFAVWNREKPTAILSAGTLGDGKKAHGQGYAFDLDGFRWDESRFMMDEYPKDRKFYVGINAHLFLHFSQVLSYNYPKHHDHFHVDFNFGFRFRRESNAQTFFVQSALRYLFWFELGQTGPEKDGVDGIYGPGATGPAVNAALKELGLAGQGGLTKPAVWKEFLKGLSRPRVRLRQGHTIRIGSDLQWYP